MTYTACISQPDRFRTLTGLSPDAFDDLLPFFREAHDEYFRYHQLGGLPRKGIRPAAIYRTSPLPSVEDRLWFILYYLRNNPTQAVMADRFGMDTSKCNKWIHTLYGILRTALSEAGVAPATNMRDLKAHCERGDPQLLSVIMHDGTEREIPRPKDADRQSENYSGKKKRHTARNAAITTFFALFPFVGQTVSGSTHDKAVADLQHFFPRESCVLQDTGHQGYRGDWTTWQPIKKTRGRSLAPHEKEWNRAVARHRVRVEHYIGSAKLMRMAGEECRVRKEGFVESMLHTAAAIHNLKRGVKLL